MFLLVQYATPFYIFLNKWNTHILPKSYHTIIPYISSYIYPIEHPTLYTTLPYHHTLYVTLNLPYRTHIYHHTTMVVQPVYHHTIPSYPIYHPKSTLQNTLPCIPPYHSIMPYISPYIYPIEQPTLYTTLPYHHTLYITLNLLYKTHISPYHHLSGIPPWWYTLYTTLQYNRTLYITLNLPHRTSYPLYHPTTPSYPIYHHKSTLQNTLPCIPPYRSIIPYLSP